MGELGTAKTRAHEYAKDVAQMTWGRSSEVSTCEEALMMTMKQRYTLERNLEYSKLRAGTLKSEAYLWYLVN